MSYELTTAADLAAVQVALGMYTAGTRVALMGDSITAYNTYTSGNETDYGQTGFFTAFNQLSGHKLFLDPALNKGTGGDTSSMMAARYDADIAANYASFDWLFCGPIGTNDYNASISPSTTIANTKAMANKALAAGKRVVLQGIFPRTGWGANNGVQKTQATKQQLYINRAIRQWAQSLAPIAPIYFVDSWRELSDPANPGTTGGGGGYVINTAAFADGLHLSGYGAALVGRRLNDELSARLPPSTYGGFGAVDGFDATENIYGNGLANPTFLTTTGGTATSVTAAGGVPANWKAQQFQTGAGSPTTADVVYSTVSAPAIGYDARLGNIAQFAVSIASGKASVTKVVLQSVNVNTAGFWVIGAKYRAIARVKLTGLAKFAGASGGLSYTPDNATQYSRADGAPNNGYAWSQDDQTLTLVSPDLTIPSDAQTNAYGWLTVNLYFDATGASAAAGTAQITDVQLVRVP